MKIFMVMIASVLPACAAAQTIPPSPPASSLAIDAKSLERAAESLGKPNARVLASKALPTADEHGDISLLREVRVTNALLSKEVSNYWLPHLSQPASAEKISAFKNWVYELLDDRGYLGSVETREEVAENGSTLVVSLKPMHLGQTKVIVASGYEPNKRYVDAVVRRFAQRFKPDTLLDVLELETQLNAASYDLPVDLSVSVRTVQPGVGDVYINLTPLEAKPLQFQNGAMQLNNYGLKQNGSEQALGVVRFEGLTAQSVATWVVQAAQNVSFYRAEYDVPLRGWHAHLRAWSSGSASTIPVNGLTTVHSNSSDLGFGSTVILHVDRYGSLQFSPEWNSHWSRDFTQGTQEIETSKSGDNQLRFKLKSESYRSTRNTFKNEITWTIGALDIQNENDLLADQMSYQRNGGYQKLEINGEFSSELSRAALITSSMRWRAQWSDKNLSVYNRIALGGTSGIRAYGAADATADQGVGLFFDLKKRVTDKMYVGILYDLAWINVAKNMPTTTTNPNYYALRGAGLQWGGEANNFNWTMNIATSFGDAQDASTDPNLTAVGARRLNFELNRSF